MPSSVSWTVTDFDGQNGIFAINTVPLTAANLAAQITLMDNLRTAAIAICDGVIKTRNINITDRIFPAANKSQNPDSQRGNKFLITAMDFTEELAAGVPNPSYYQTFTYDFPCGNMDLRVNNSNILWVAGGGANVPEVDTFVTAFEAIAKSPNGGDFQVNRVEAVTRVGG